MSLGQTNVAGGNTSELEARIDRLETSVDELDTRMDAVEESTKKYYLTIAPPPKSGTGTYSTTYMSHDGRMPLYLDNGSQGVAIHAIGYNILLNGTSQSKLVNGKTLSGLTSDTVMQVDYKAPITFEINGTLAGTMWSDTDRINTINLYKFGTKTYTKTCTTYSSETFSYTEQILVDKNIKIFRSTISGTSLNVYIEEYTPQ